MNERRSVTIFFRNFPEWCSGEELRRKFEGARRVVDLFIPIKRDKAGFRFGFARFREEGAVEELMLKLNRIWIGNFVIRAFFPKYDRNRSPVWPATSRKIGFPVEGKGQQGRGRSFSEVLKGKSDWVAKQQDGVGERAATKVVQF